MRYFLTNNVRNSANNNLTIIKDMKKLLMIFVAMLGLMSCSSGKKTEESKHQETDRVEVIYFHGKKRCPTCMAIENNAKSVVDSLFAEELKNGTVVYKTVDISTPEGEKTADKYEVTWSSLYVNKWKDGVETRENMTDFGFGNARKNPDAFKNGVADKIREFLK